MKTIKSLIMSSGNSELITAFEKFAEQAQLRAQGLHELSSNDETPLMYVFDGKTHHYHIAENAILSVARWLDEVAKW